MTHVRLRSTPDGLALESPYDSAFVIALKQLVPASQRRWDGANKVWVIDAQYGIQIADLAYTFFSTRPDVPNTTASTQSVSEMRTLQLDYLGACYERADKSVYASGYAPWAGGPFDKQRPSYIFPEAVLMLWFGYDAEPVRPAEPSQAPRPKVKQTLYQVLGLRNDAGLEDIKKAHRRLARQWHPDYCTEMDAAVRFHEIQQAYDKLRDPDTRRKYDVGLKLAKLADQALKNEEQRRSPMDYRNFQDDDRQPRFRAPLRCGLLFVEGRQVIAGFHVEKILAWEDVVNVQGQTMTSSWLGNSYVIKWV